MADKKSENRLVESSRKEGDAVVAALTGEVDLNCSPRLRAELMELIARDKPKRLVLNLGKVRYMDSSAIAVLVEVLRKVGKGGSVILTTLQPRVKGILEIARLNEVFTIVAEEKDAMDL